MNKKLLLPLVIVFTLLAISQGYTQSISNSQLAKVINYPDNVKAPLTSNEMKMLKEVYADQLHNNVLSKPQRLKDIKHLLRNRIEIKLTSNPKDQKQCTLLSQVSLFNNYVKDLKRDTSFNPRNFNPLKYMFKFFSGGPHMYRADNTNYFIIIKTQQL